VIAGHQMNRSSLFQPQTRKNDRKPETR